MKNYICQLEMPSKGRDFVKKFSPFGFVFNPNDRNDRKNEA
jgi:hypothetical protein